MDASRLKNHPLAVLFDLYGTLVDVGVDEDSPSFWEALARDCFLPERVISGVELHQAFLRLADEPASDHAEGFLLDALFARLLASYGREADPEAVARFARAFRRYSIARLDKKPYTDELLSRIRQAGCRLGLVSNTEALLTDYDLEILGLDASFDVVILSSRAGVKKPDPRIFALALDSLGARPEHCVFVGDNAVDDISGALAAGMNAVYLTDKAQADTPGRAVCAGFSLGEILAALRGLGFRI